MSVPSPVPPETERFRPSRRLRSTDGTELVADLYLPANQEPAPAVFQVTPYDARSLERLGRIYADRGYLFAAVDARGRFRSEGSWEPMLHDRNDGHAVVEWLARHDRCDGQIGSRGHSYSGYSQMLTAVDAPDALRAMVVGFAPGEPFENVPFCGGAYDVLDLLWLVAATGRIDRIEEEDFGGGRFGTWNETQGITPEQHEAMVALEEARATLDPGRQIPEHLEEALRARPFAEADLRLGVRQSTFREWIDHWSLDDYWKMRSPGEIAGRIDAETLFVTGWWDTNGRGATDFFRRLRTAEGEGDSHRLLIGAWDHFERAPDTRDLPAEEAAYVERAAERDALNDEFAWFDRHLRDLSAGPSTGSDVTLYLTGAHEWRELEDWPPPETRGRRYFLHSGEEGRSLVEEPGTASEATTTYEFDPAEPTPWGPDWVGGEPLPFDNGAADARPDVVSFDTAAVDEPLVIVGELRAVLWASADVPDFDLHAKLLDVHPDGRAIYLADGIRRARFRNGWDQPELLEGDSVGRYALDLWHLGHLLRPGHRLRLQVSSSALLRYDVNPCTGEHPARAVETRTARVSLHHDSDHRSHLDLPVWQSGTGGKDD